MAVKKMRGISLDFWTDEKVVALSPLARLLFLGSWHYACDQGHLGSTPMELKMRVLPADSCDIYALVEEIVEQGLYVRDENGALSVPKLPEHQRLDKRYLITCERCGTTSEPPEDPEGTTRDARGDHAGTTREHEGTHAEGEGEGEGERKVKGARARKRATTLPDIFPITEEMAAWGREHAPLVDAPREHEKFIDYWRGVGKTKVDWVATWRNWMRKAQEFAEERAPKHGGDDRPDWMLA